MPDIETTTPIEESETPAAETTAKQNKQRIKEITESIETGIREMFETERYQTYLSTMSRFHKYSVNNTMLIYMQRPDATLVAGFNKWRDQFGRHVKKGEKGIQIIAPTPVLKKIQETVLDPDTLTPVLDADGNEMTEERTVKIPLFKPVSVFDVSQTEGKPLPELVSTLSGDVEQYDAFVEALRRSFPVPITFEPMAAGMDGYFSTTQHRIAIREGMSQVQTISAMIHEIGHSKLHDYERIRAEAMQTGTDTPKEKDRNTEEVEAESISYAVCQYYGIETAENSFGYIATWSKGKELKELRSSLETISKTVSSLITDIDRNFAEIRKERGLDPKTEEKTEAEPEKPSPVEQGGKEALILLDNSKYLHLQRTEDGYDYSLYDAATKKLEAGGYFLAEAARCHAGKTEMWKAIAEACVREGYGDAKKTLMPLDRVKDLLEANPPPNAPANDALEEAPAEQPAPDSMPREKPERGPQACAPDHIINPKALEFFGYTDESMLPLSKDRAMELFARDVPIYLIYRDNTEALAFEPEEILEHDGLFGVTREDWEAVKADIPPRDIQRRFLDDPRDGFVIYQLNGDQREFMFLEYDRLEEPPTMSQYHPVYIGVLTAPSMETGAQLEALFQTFNMDRPADYTTHSMSPSDIVALKRNGVVSYHYCDSVGFQQLQNFAPPENYLKNAEMAMEDDYGMIDGIINNGPKQPTVAELEAQVKAGQPISLTDLANAVQAERREKPSILERLKKPLEPQETNKPKQQRQRNDAERGIL